MVVVLRLMFLLKNLINCKFPKVQSYTFAVLILKTCPFSYQNHLLLEPINCLSEIFLCTENIQVLDKFKKNWLTYIAKYIYIYIFLIIILETFTCCWSMLLLLVFSWSVLITSFSIPLQRTVGIFLFQILC